MSGCPDYDFGCRCTRCEAADDAIPVTPTSEAFAAELRGFVDGQGVREPPCHGFQNGCGCPKCKQRSSKRSPRCVCENSLIAAARDYCLKCARPVRKAA